jgi:hypothetical protein
MALDSELFARQVWYCDSRAETVLRGHLWIEYLLEKLLVVAFARPTAVNLERLTWSYKLQLCDGLGLLSPDRVPALAEVNKIRNRLAHDLAGEPCDADIARVIDLSPDFWREGAAAVRVTEETADRVGDDTQLADMRYWFFAVVMDLDHLVETREWEDANRDGLWRATAVKVAKDMTKDPISMQEAERLEGLPPRPQPGDSFRSGKSAPPKE